MNIEKRHEWEAYFKSNEEFNTRYFYKRAAWKLKFAWFPKICDISNRKIWLETGYKGTSTKEVFVDMGMSKTTISETRWLSKQEFIFGKIAGTI